MSIDTILYNTTILDQLATSLGPHFPDTGITSLTGDSNITCNVAGRDGTVHLNPNIAVTDINVTGVVKLGGSSGTSGQVLKSNGSSPPTWGSLSVGVTSVTNTDTNITISPTVGAVVANMASSVSLTNLTVNSITNLKADLQSNGNSGTAGQVLTSGGAGAAPTWSSSASTSGLLKNIYLSQVQQPTLSSQVTLTLFTHNLTGLTVGKTQIVDIGITMYLDTGGSLYPILYSLIVASIGTQTITSYATALGEHFYRNFRFSFVPTATSHLLTLTSNCVGGSTLNIVDESDYYTIQAYEVQ